MKKLILALLVFTMSILRINALDNGRVEVRLIKCEDALSSWIEVDDKKVRIKLIATDTSDGDLNNEIDSYICNLLTKSQKIEIEYDPKKTELDEYNRLNVWLYADSNLIQEDLIEKGYAQVNFIEDNYLYLDSLCDKQKDAISSKLGIWNYPNQEEKYCKSGISLNSEASNEIEKEILEKKDYSYLYDLICLILFIIALSMILKIKRSKNG